MPDPVVHFEVPADDVERAHAFYRATFGWTIQSIPGMGYSLLGTRTPSGTTPASGDADHRKAASATNPASAPPLGIDGGMLRRQAPVDRIVVTVQVADIDAALRAVQANGGQVLRGKLEVPGVGFTAYVEDTEGNRLGLMQARS